MGLNGVWMVWLLVGGCNEPTSRNHDTFEEGELEISVQAHSLDVVTLPGDAADGVLTCTLDVEPTEIHVASAQHVDTVIENGLRVRGLLADSVYTCTWEGPAVSTWGRVRTGMAAENIPELVLTGDPAAIVGTYTLFNHLEKGEDPNQQKLLIVDPQGRVRWSYLVPYKAAGDLDATLLGGGQILYGGGYGGKPQIVNLDGEVVFRSGGPLTGDRYHHHVEPVGESDILALVTVQNSHEGDTFTGFGVEMFDRLTRELHWSWNSQVAVDQGWPLVSGNDPFHANWVGVEERDDGARTWVNMRTPSRLCRFVQETGELDWCLGAGGDYRLLDMDGSELSDQEWFYHQHAPEFSGDRVLIHDNGTNRPEGHFSRVLELEIDEVAMTATKTWEWTEPGWQEPIWGDVDIVGDHVLITRGHCVDCARANPDSNSSLVELDREREEVVWQLDVVDPKGGLYRSQRLDGCDVFYNAKWCAQVME
ncbi:MAG: aryl-sulfate sulfotransferase [Myxococcota bacterium]|nr:aryl-sulfate sulfotransferase [Myxococcota bacterium]